MSRSYNKSSGNSVRSDAFESDFKPGRNLFPASQIPADKKPAAITSASERIMSEATAALRRSGDEDLFSAKLGGNIRSGNFAKRLAEGMVNGDKSNGLEDYFPKGMSTAFGRALSKSGYAPGPDDPDTIKAIGQLIAIRAQDEAGKQELGGSFETRVERTEQGYRILAFTSDYEGRDDDGEKSYRNSPEKPIAFIPHDEVSRSNPSSLVGTKTPTIFNSPAYIKAQALRGYLDALLLTS